MADIQTKRLILGMAAAGKKTPKNLRTRAGVLAMVSGCDVAAILAGKNARLQSERPSVRVDRQGEAGQGGDEGDNEVDRFSRNLDEVKKIYLEWSNAEEDARAEHLQTLAKAVGKLLLLTD